MRAIRFQQSPLKHVAALGLAVLFAVPAAAGPALPDSPQAWRAAAEADIAAAVQVTRDNHPGARDPYNPGFLANLEAARVHGLALAARVRDAAGYNAALDGFNVRIGDGHAAIRSLVDAAARPPARWPGFVTAWRGDALYVAASPAGQPAVGSKLLGCDGMDARRLIRDNVFSFEGRVQEAGQWWSVAPTLFVDAHNPFVTLPQRCSFEAGGQASEHVLAWREVDAQAKRLLAESEEGVPRPVGMFAPRPNLVWVSMPSFKPDEAQRAAYRAIYRDIEGQRARWLALDAVVVDLRGNGGGSSAWSLDFARALWGGERVAAARAAYSPRSETWWRASPANTEYMLSAARQLADQGSTEMAAWARSAGEGMRAALARNEDFHVEKKTVAAPAATPAAAAAPFTRPVYVVVPGHCASACLDAIDILTRFPNTTLVGAPSSADSTYMDVRRHPLASGLAAMVVPNKMVVNRERDNGQYYEPRLPVRDLVWSVETLLETIEADLARGQPAPQAYTPRSSGG
ncbi:MULTISPECIES: S41 family peptidase [unclassified Massilia]|uniref:S41 family peptidase n=1 Tax=unclassified Massilia TaxID=2609279 RepID=UPI00177CED97|nr:MULTISPECIES: S41 family peptidase [unclassified Massilia]MBD8533108.1 hypothetical protein [Massilia sp. CFBP 13647]MBD8676535.1 hypothetical protein [Massilia sp. CFBP 13721]